MNNTPTPETYDNDTQAELAAWNLLAEARRERDELRRWTSVNGVLELQRERDELREVIRQTIMENLHLADGDDCTLKKLKDSIGFDLDSLNETSPSLGTNE